MLSRLRHAEKLQETGPARTDATKVGLLPWMIVVLLLIGLGVLLVL